MLATHGPALLPEVNAMLISLGLRPLDPVTLVAQVGRNENWVGSTETGRAVFIKRIVGYPDECTCRIRRMIAAESLAGRAGFPNIPRCLGWDMETRLLVFDLIDGVRDGARLAENGDFDDETAWMTGRMVGTLHRMTGPELAAVDTSEAHLPPVDEMVALPWRVFHAASAGELDVWRILQHDPILAKRMGDLRRAARRVRPVPVHGDLRLDQVLVSHGTIYLADWEEFRMADPARDVGSFVGEWLYRSILAITANDSCPDDVPFSDEEVLARGVAEFTRVRTCIEAFWDGYRLARGSVEAEFSMRAAAFAGWHQFDRLLATAHRKSRLSPIELAAAGIGRSVLVNPERVVDALGLGTEP